MIHYLQRPKRSAEHLHLLHRQTVRATAPLPAAHHQDPLTEQREEKTIQNVLLSTHITEYFFLLNI